MNIENTSICGTKKRWRHDVTMSSENSQGYLSIPCEFYSSFANQIMCNKQSALELPIILDKLLWYDAIH